MTLKRKIQLKWKGLLNLLGLFGLIAIAFASVQKKDDGQIQSIVVTVDDYQDKSLLSPLDVKNIILENFDNTLLNRKISRLDLQLIEAIISEEEMVNRTEVFVDYQNNLHVEVWTKKPVFRVFTEDQSVYVDDLGNVFPTSSNHTVRVPIVTGSLPWLTQDDREEKRKLMEMMEQVAADQFLNALIEQVNITRKGTYEFTPKLGHAKIHFGEPVEIQEKLQRLKRFYTKTVKKTGLETFVRIDLDYKGQVVCQLSDDKT